MILVADVGNTNMTFGVYDGKELKCSFRMMAKTPRTSDEYSIQLISMLELNGIYRKDIEGAIIASVVPQVMHALINGIIKTTGARPYIVGPGIKTGIKIVTDNPREVGPDLIVGVVAAFEKYGGPVMVIDYGTATTFVPVNEKGEFFAGIVCPGIRISAKALWEDTAKLPEIEIKKPDSILAKETTTSMQAGLIYGQIGQTKYIIEQVKKESGYPGMKVVATGGLGRLLSGEVEEIDYYEPNLLLDGLRILYEKNRKNKPTDLGDDNQPE